MAAPVLVTGAPRSGTTWVGRTLTLSGELGELYEPFNPAAGPSPEAMRTALRTWRTARGHRRHHRTAMAKDPLALFSTPWLARELGFRPVILVRHPAAFVSSLVRVGWQVRFGSWLRQPLLMDSLLAPWAERIERAQESEGDLVGDGALLWAVCYDVVRRWRDEHPDWLVVRHEDLSADPERAFAELFGALGLSWTGSIAAAIGASTSAQNPTEVSSGAQHELARDSRGIAALWRSRLSDADVRVIRAVTADVGQAFYGEDMWA